MQRHTYVFKMCWKKGVPKDEDERHELWRNCHCATLEEYGILNGDMELYHPDARQIFEG